MPSVHCLLNYRHIFRDAHDRINHHRSHAGARWQNYSLLPWHVPMLFFAQQLVLFVVPVLIRLMEHRVAASVPLTPHPPCLLGPGGLGHKATGSGEGGGQDSMWGAPQGFLVLFACLEPRISMTRANTGIAVLYCWFQIDDRHWKIILTFKTN